MSKLENIAYAIAGILDVDLHSRREKACSVTRVALMEAGAYSSMNLLGEKLRQDGDDARGTYETLYSDGSVCLDLIWRGDGESLDRGVKIVAFQKTDMNVVFSENGSFRDILDISQEDFDNEGFNYGLEEIPNLGIDEMLAIAEKFAQPNMQVK